MPSKLFCYIFYLLTIVSLAILLNCAVIKVKANAKTPWGLMEFLAVSSDLQGFNGTWITDNEFYYPASDSSLRKYNAATKIDTLFVKSEFLTLYDSDASYTFSPDITKILVRYDVEGVFRHSLIAKYDILDIENGATVKIHNGEKLQYCGWSPIKDRLAFVYNNNVYVRLEDNTEKQITDTGIKGIVYLGVPDWVYEEEVLSSGSALWWSPDGQKLALGVFDDRDVQTFKYYMYGEAENPQYLYPEEVDLKYPKPGTTNPIVALRVYDLSGGAVQAEFAKITAPVDIVTEDHILQNVAWSNDDQLIITWLNRRQNVGTMQQCTLAGMCHEILNLKEPDGWITIGTPKCLKSSANCLFTYWIGDKYQIWNLDLLTGKNIWSEIANFTVLNIYGYDEEKNTLYYQATAENSSEAYHVYSNSDCLTCAQRDIDGAKCRSASATFSKGFSHYTIVCNGPNPSYSKIFDSKTHTEIIEWESNTEFRQMLEHKLRPSIEYLEVKNLDGTMGTVKLQYPPNFDRTKKYPMIVNVYGAPNSVFVTSSFELEFSTYLTTSLGVIYAQIDGRGTGNKGKSILFSVNNHLGELEVEDQIFITKTLQNLTYVDRERTGIWGWSYGGFMTAKILANDAERVFRCGISVAPVTSWLYYDSIYTERYMGVPKTGDDIKRYHDSSVFGDLKNFRNHDFMLIHGSGDDNVHYQHSVALANQLQKEGINFNFQTYPDEKHSLDNSFNHLYTIMDIFWRDTLNLDVEENNFKRLGSNVGKGMAFNITPLVLLFSLLLHLLLPLFFT